MTTKAAIPRMTATDMRKSFAPATGEIGSWVSWYGVIGYETRKVVGQVWAKSCHRHEVWVVRTLPCGHNIALSILISDLRPAADPAKQLELVAEPSVGQLRGAR